MYILMLYMGLCMRCMCRTAVTLAWGDPWLQQTCGVSSCSIIVFLGIWDNLYYPSVRELGMLGMYARRHASIRIHLSNNMMYLIQHTNTHTLLIYTTMYIHTHITWYGPMVNDMLSLCNQENLSIYRQVGQ